MRKIEVIFAGAIPPCVPKRVIEFGGERQFAKKIAEGGFVEHKFSHRVRRETQRFFFKTQRTLWLCGYFNLVSLNHSTLSTTPSSPNNFIKIDLNASISPDV